MVPTAWQSDQMTARELIIDAAATEMSLRGYAAASLSSVAAHLHLTKGALARRFPTKDLLAQEIVSTLRDSIAAARHRASVLYPDSGVRALVHFLLDVEDHARDNLRNRAAVVLLIDRSSPVFGVADTMIGWKSALLGFFELASQRGEIDETLVIEDIVDAMFARHIGELLLEGVVTEKTEARPRLRFTRLSLKAAGVRSVDSVVDAVVGQRSNREVETPADR